MLPFVNLLVKVLEPRQQELITDQLRAGTISPAVATSLLNDSGYTQDVCKSLIAFGESLFTRDNECSPEIMKTQRLNVRLLLSPPNSMNWLRIK